MNFLKWIHLSFFSNNVKKGNINVKLNRYVNFI